MIEISSIKPPTRQQFPTDALKMYENKRSKWLPFPKVQGNILPASTRETSKRFALISSKETSL